jgi:mannose-6-phosphate isomerase-like protein (cupin superfamily)
MTTPRADELRSLLIRNHETAELTPFVRGTRYESLGASFTAGLAARDLGVSVDIVPPGKCACPYHLHHAEEEMFIVLEGQGTLRVAGERLPLVRGDVDHHPGRAGVPAPHRQHLGCAAEVPVDQHAAPARGVRVPGLGQGQRLSGGRILIHRKAESLDYWDGEPGA